MYFTQEDYKKIEEYLKQNSKRDTDFPSVTEVTNDDYVPIIQDNENKKISVNALRSELEEGPAGESAYEAAVRHGYQGTEEEWLASMQGESAYQIACDEGFIGTPEEWLASLKGEQGDAGKDADVWTIGDDDYWYCNGIKTDFKSKGEDGQPLMLRISKDGQSLEISSDGGQTWLPFEKNFNKLRVLGYLDDKALLPKSANVGDIYGVKKGDEEIEPGVAAYDLWINTVVDWTEDYVITKIYDYDTELPSSAKPGTAVLVPVTDLTMDKEKVDGYKVYKYSIAKEGWVLVLNTSTIYASKEDIINYGDNLYALVQGEEEGTYVLYRRVTDWVYFGTNASITYVLKHEINEGASDNILDGEIVKTGLLLLARGVNAKLSVSPSTIYKNVATTVTLTGVVNKAQASQIDKLTIYENGTQVATSTTSPITYSPSITVTENTKTFDLEATVKGMIFPDSVSINARYPIYYGFGTEAASVAVNANRFSATTSAVQTYTKSNSTDGQHFYILVPEDITDVNSFTMGGAPFVMNAVTTQQIGGVTYKVHESGNIYNSGVTLKVSATY